MRKWTQGELGTALRNLKQRVPHFAGGAGCHNKENQQAPTAAEPRRRTVHHVAEDAAVMFASHRTGPNGSLHCTPTWLQARSQRKYWPYICMKKEH